ncbi:MAG: hypothetical protein MJK04_37950, partial [Psychrosphaera sp.]|nr:hypothetical protein [Psychrosphaera sp.]
MVSVIRIIGGVLFLLHLFCASVAIASQTSNQTLKTNLIKQIVYNPIIAADVNCSEAPVNDATELYAWRIFSKLNLPMYYGQVDDRTDAIFVGQLDNWQLKSSNTAPLWSTLLRH